MLSPNLDIEKFAAEFQIKKRIQIQNALQPEFAERLHHCLDAEVPWGVAYVGADGKPEILTSDRVSGFTDKEWAAINGQVLKTASHDFQFLYNSYMVLNAYLQKRDPGLLLHRMFEYLNGDYFLTFVRKVTGRMDIARVDAQATRYIPGSVVSG
jgi:Rps23 Pro-64 3,4-dihydroxylase Tpa1-like proline 4-hydroxylase